VFTLDKAMFAYEPYPVSYCADVFSADDYLALAKSYPAVELFQHKPELGDKYSLSERNNGDKYSAFLRSEPIWAKLHAFVKSERFIRDTFAYLKSRNIDLGLDRFRFTAKPRAKKSGLVSRILGYPELGARFEFSAMGGNGGHILPHTDSPNKLVTFVLSMNVPGEWDEAWGGGTQICMPKDHSRIFNHVNRYMGFDDVDVSTSYDFLPNQCILFIKTYNSWHQVSPIVTPPGAPLRKTLTINIERMK
jgi:hypothetical protein